jgi:fatty acid desaturase
MTRAGRNRDRVLTTRDAREPHSGKMPHLPVSHYTRALRPSLPDEAFEPAHSRLLWLPVHLGTIVLATLAIARGWVAWPLVPVLSLVIGCAFAGLTFLGHETLHGAVVRNPLLRRVVGFIGFLPFSISPKLWVAWHNRVHHANANVAGKDPDAYPTVAAYHADRKTRWVTDHLAPGRSRLAGLIALAVGFSVQSFQVLLVASARGIMSRRAHLVAIGETALAYALWTSLGFAVGGLAFLFVFVLPLVIANVIVMAFIFTNHSLSPLGDVNDPLANSLSVTLPRWAEWLTMRFGFHVEHHLFPGMSSRHAPLVRERVLLRWPERYQSMSLGRALLRLHRSPRVYQDEIVLVDPNTGASALALAPRPIARRA